MYTPPWNSPPFKIVSSPGTPVSTRPMLRLSIMRYSTTRHDDAEARGAICTLIRSDRASHSVDQGVDDPQPDAETAGAPCALGVKRVRQLCENAGIDPR